MEVKSHVESRVKEKQISSNISEVYHETIIDVSLCKRG